MAEETLRSLEAELDFEPEELVTMAGKTPGDVTPSNPLEVELYRQVKRITRAQKEELLEDLKSRRREDD